MDERELRCEALLTTYREADAIDDPTADRISKKLATNLDRDPPWLKVSGPEGTEQGHRPMWAAVAAASIAVAAALALWISTRVSTPSVVDGSTALAAELSAERSASGGVAVVGDSEAPGSNHAAANRERHAVPVPEPDPIAIAIARDETIESRPEAPTDSDPIQQPRTPKRRRGPATAPPPAEVPALAEAPAPVPSLAEEVAHLHAADEALRAGRPADAWRELQSYRDKFHPGALATEASALRTVTRCALGHADAAAAAARFLERAPKTSYRRRIENACGGEAAK